MIKTKKAYNKAFTKFIKTLDSNQMISFLELINYKLNSPILRE